MRHVVGSVVRCLCVAAALAAWHPLRAADAAPGDAPAIIIPSWKQAPIAKDRAAAIAADNQRTLTGVWTVRKPSTAPAETMALLGLLERAFDGDETVTGEMVEKATLAAIQAGSTDPMVRYAQARFADHDRAAALAHLREAAMGLDRSPYPANRAGAAWARLASEQLGRQGHVDQDVSDHAIDALKAWLIELPDADTGALEVLRVSSAPLCSEGFLSGQGASDKLLAALADPTVPTWWSHVLQARVHISLAWMARGSGWGSAVTDAGWKGMAEHLRLARENLVAAWRSHPERSLAPTLMITVAMGGATEDGDCLAWFQRAVAAQMDDIEAYTNLSYAWTPRWGGSYEKMLALGDAAAQTKRFDTAVPWQLIYAARAIWLDAHSLKAERPEILDKDVYARCCAVMEGMARQMDEAHRAKVQAYYACQRAILAYMCAMPDETIRQLDAAKGIYVPLAFHGFPLTAAQLREAAQAPASGDSGPVPRPAAPARQDADPPM